LLLERKSEYSVQGLSANARVAKAWVCFEFTVGQTGWSVVSQLALAKTSSQKMASKTAKQNKQNKRSSSPVADIEFADAADDVPDQSISKDGVDDATEKLIFRIRQASSDIYKEQHRPARNDEIAEILGVEESAVKSARDTLKRARQNRKLSALRKKALQAGFSRRNGMTNAEAAGLDMERTLITPSDIKRLMRAIPLDFDGGSYTAKEAKMRIDMMYENLPVGSAREIIAFVEPLFRSVVTECVDRQLRLRTQRITPATMYSVLKKYDNGVFTSVEAPEGLIKYAKKDGVDLENRKDADQGMLMNASTDDKKKWKSMSSKNKDMAEYCKNVQQEEKTRLENKRKSQTKGEEEPVDQDEDENEVEEEKEAEPPQPKKKRSKASK